MINIGATLFHGLFQVTIENAISHVEKYSAQDHVLGIMVALEIIQYRRHPAAC